MRSPSLLLIHAHREKERLVGHVPGIIEKSTTGGFRPSGGGVEENSS